MAMGPIVHANSRYIADIRSFSHQVLQIHKEHLVSVKAGDHTLDATLDKKETILIHIAKIAGVDPDQAIIVLAHDIGSLLRSAEISLHHSRAGNTYLTHFIIGFFLAGLRIKDANGSIQRRDAHTSLLIDSIDTERCCGRKLRHAVALG